MEMISQCAVIVEHDFPKDSRNRAYAMIAFLTGVAKPRPVKVDPDYDEEDSRRVRDN
ncbi:MAG: hypothetical protein NVS3B20_03340 [Polyangiales bacterium]